MNYKYNYKCIPCKISAVIVVEAGSEPPKCPRCGEYMSNIAVDLVKPDETIVFNKDEPFLKEVEERCECYSCINTSHCEFESMNMRGDKSFLYDKSAIKCTLYKNIYELQAETAITDKEIEAKETELLKDMHVEDIIEMPVKDFTVMCSNATVKELQRISGALSIGIAEMNAAFGVNMKAVQNKGDFNLIVDQQVAKEFNYLLSISRTIGEIDAKTGIVSYFSYEKMPDCFKTVPQQ